MILSFHGSCFCERLIKMNILNYIIPSDTRIIIIMLTGISFHELCDALYVRGMNIVFLYDIHVNSYHNLISKII